MTATTEPGSSLTTRNAQITTAAVQIKTLTVSGKQVTLAVFRQLFDRDLVNTMGDLNGTPWGTVNYHPERCADAWNHRHVVWESRGELFRARMEVPRWNAETFEPEGADPYIQSTYCIGDHKYRNDWKRWPWGSGHGVRFSFDGMPCQTEAQPECPSYGPAGAAANDHVCKTQDEYEQAAEWLRGDIADERARRQRITEHWQMILGLPQLFIAV